MPTTPELRSPTSSDLQTLWALNEAAVPHVGQIGIERMQWFMEQASYFRAAVVGEELLGFLLGLTPEADYGSPNFRWFQERYPSFVYIDRVVVAPSVQRSGLGAKLYGDIEVYTHGYAPLLACEVNLEPPNPVSIAFHQARGFRRVGTRTDPGSGLAVCYMVKEIPCG